SSWSDDDKTCYETALEIIDRAARYIEEHDRGPLTFGGRKVEPLSTDVRKRTIAEIIPFLRGRVSASRRFLATVQDGEKMRRFGCSVDGPRLGELGTSCPDHFLRTKIKPLFVDWNPASGDVEALKQSLATGLERYRDDYARYYERCRRPDSPPMRDP